MIPLYSSYISKKAKKNVNQCLISNWISSKGSFVKKFEDSFSKFTKIKHSISVSNGTCAIHLALLSLGIKKNDEVIVPSFTYIASVNPIKYIGAKPIFIDSNLNDLQMNIADIEKKITTKTKAILCPHLYGNMTNIEHLIKLKKKYQIFLIEDCAESFGSYFKKKHSGKFGDIATFSFYGNKTITTGEGGMVCTDNRNLAKIIYKLKTQGLAKEQRPYYHDILGYNYRMTNICAALGYSQLFDAKKIIKRKREIYFEYKKNFSKNKKLRILEESENIKSSYWLIVILLNNLKIKNKLIKYLEEVKIETRPTFYPVHKMPMYNNGKSYKNAEKLGSCGICLPSYPKITNKQIEYISKKINLFLNEK